MVCRYCSKEMTKDDCDFNFKGNYDNHWVCEHCGASCVESIRFSKVFKIRWLKGKKR